MPDVRSPRRTMAEENSTPKRLLGDQDRGSPHRGWKCPSDEMIASYLDAAVDSPSRSRLESHLTDCEYCRAWWQNWPRFNEIGRCRLYPLA
jgi:hypothetical protein